MENIKYRPTGYEMSQELKNFFTLVTNQCSLQSELYDSSDLTQVAEMAQKLGFKVTASEILMAQAGRILAIIQEGSNDVQELLAGHRPKTCAQWGRGGKLHVDRAGYWLLNMDFKNADSLFEKDLQSFLSQAKTDEALREKLLMAKSYNNVALIAHDYGYNLSATSLLQHQAKQILLLTLEEAMKLLTC